MRRHSVVSAAVPQLVLTDCVCITGVAVAWCEVCMLYRTPNTEVKNLFDVCASWATSFDWMGRHTGAWGPGRDMGYAMSCRWMTRSVNETRRLIFLTFSVLAHEMKFALRRKTGTAAATINAHTHGATFNVERDRFELRNGAARYCRCSGWFKGQQLTSESLVSVAEDPEVSRVFFGGGNFDMCWASLAPLSRHLKH